MISGSLLINKNAGVTSRFEVNNVSHILNEKKAGHIGTLDPFADGLLIVLLGKSTKIAPFLECLDKTYVATLKLGQKTNTGDLTGDVIEIKDVPILTKDLIENIFSQFVGKISQIPPMYSALKVNGKQLYKYARSGENIERKPRSVEIFSIKLISFDIDTIIFETRVSKGTYIRTLGEDIAGKLGCVGHLSNLTRTKIGNYCLENAIKSENVKQTDLLSNEIMLSSYENIVLSDENTKKALNGMKLRLSSSSKLVLVSDENGIIAVYKHENDNLYSCLRGLR